MKFYIAEPGNARARKVAMGQTQTETWKDFALYGVIAVFMFIAADVTYLFLLAYEVGAVAQFAFNIGIVFTLVTATYSLFKGYQALLFWRYVKRKQILEVPLPLIVFYDREHRNLFQNADFNIRKVMAGDCFYQVKELADFYEKAGTVADLAQAFVRMERLAKMIAADRFRKQRS